MTTSSRHRNCWMSNCSWNNRKKRGLSMPIISMLSLKLKRRLENKSCIRERLKRKLTEGPAQEIYNLKPSISQRLNLYQFWSFGQINRCQLMRWEMVITTRSVISHCKELEKTNRNCLGNSIKTNKISTSNTMETLNLSILCGRMWRKWQTMFLNCRSCRSQYKTTP